MIRQKRPMAVVSSATLNALDDFRTRICTENIVEALVPSAYFN
jgi:hypothetical protein